MQRSGFTMIELIFVIVILGILASVALPKLAETQKQAAAGKIEAFVGTLNRTVMPSMWSKAIKENNGSIGHAITFTTANYTEIPDGVTLDTTMADCNKTAGNNIIGTVDLGQSGIINIYCVDGTTTVAPKAGFDQDANTTTIDVTAY